MQIWFGVLESAVDQPEGRQDPRPGMDMTFSVGFAQCGDQQFDRLPDLAPQGGDFLGSVCAVFLLKSGKRKGQQELHLVAC